MFVREKPYGSNWLRRALRGTPAGILPILAQCCANLSMVLVLQMQLWHLHWLVFIEPVDDLRSKVSSKRMSVWLTWSRISVVWIHLHVAVSLCVWLFTSQPCYVLCFLSTRNRVPYRCNLILRWHVSRKLNVEGGMLCIAPRGWSCRIELHSFIGRYCCLQAWRKPPRLCLFVCFLFVYVCVWVASADQRSRTI